MALKVLMLRKNLNDTKKAYDALMDEFGALEKREADIAEAIEEAETDEERGAVEAEIDAFEAEKTRLEEEKAKLETRIEELENDIMAEEEEQIIEPAPAPAEEPDPNITFERSSNKMTTRDKIFNRMNEQERGAFFAREDVKEFLGDIRSCIKEKRALTNVGLVIPEVLLGVLRENVERFSKLYSHVNVRAINGKGRELIMGQYDEAVWTECCANLNELSLAFYDQEVDCYMVAGYYAICNANIEDSDIDLASEVMTAIGQAIGRALDKAILYGRNSADNQKMPQGVVSRLAETSQPSGYSPTARPWVDLHETNIVTIPQGTTGADLIKAIVGASAAMKGKYSRGEKVWLMNEATYTALGTATITTAADGSIVSGIFERMPVIGGIIEVLDFIPDNVIIGGYFDLYLLAERAGQQFASSEHVRFLQSQTVFKGVARYDGAPTIAEAFVAIGINGTTPDATMTFAADTANAGA